MFPRLQRKFVFLYTLSTGLIMTFILSGAFLLYTSSRVNLLRSDFQERLFALTSRLQTDFRFADSFLAQMELKYRLIISIEENNVPFFFPGSYVPRTDRRVLMGYAEEAASAEGISPDSPPVSSDLLQSSIFQIDGDLHDTYLGNVLVIRTVSGCKRLLLLMDITDEQSRILKTGGAYVLIDLCGILLLFLSGRWFVRRSLRPLEETCQKQEDFVAAASHELRSPLAVIRATADAATAKPEEARRLLAVIQNECDRGSSLIRNLLLLVCAGQEKWAVKKQRFELDEMLLNLLELYEPLCRARGAGLLLELPDEPLPKITADPDLCRQIITILLDNAAAYGLTDKDTAAAKEDMPAIVIRASHSCGHTVVSVIDHGPGIPDEKKALIFDRFYRQDRSRQRKEHFGLGLSIAAALAEIQGIRLNVADTEGGGTTFSVRI
ncbi:MAG: HAMP domain-containing histidine kinase [Lachnospiraceae bacterium]